MCFHLKKTKQTILLYGSKTFSPFVLVWSTITMMKHHGKSKLRRKVFIWFMFPHHCVPLEEVRTRTEAGQEPGGRS